jgi:hypothetical protein
MCRWWRSMTRGGMTQWLTYNKYIFIYIALLSMWRVGLSREYIYTTFRVKHDYCMTLSLIIILRMVSHVFFSKDCYR